MWRDNKILLADIGDYLCIAGVSYLEEDQNETLPVSQSDQNGSDDPKALNAPSWKRETYLNRKLHIQHPADAFPQGYLDRPCRES
jgi:hypothetical protein